MHDALTVDDALPQTAPEHVESGFEQEGESEGMLRGPETAGGEPAMSDEEWLDALRGEQQVQPADPSSQPDAAEPQVAPGMERQGSEAVKRARGG